MMVEAGGTEKAWSYYEAGAPKVTEAVIADGLEACKVWIRESIDLQNELVAKAGAASRPSPGRTSSTTPTRSTAAVRRDRRGQARRRPTRSPTRPSATPPTTRSRPRSSPSSPARAAPLEGQDREVKSGLQGRSPRRSSASGSSTRASASTAVASPTCVPCPPRSGSSPRRTAPACSSVARPRSSTS